MSAAVLARAESLTAQFKQRVAATPDRVALRRKVNGRWEDISWKGYYEAASKVGRALMARGLTKGDAAAVLSNTRFEWCFCDLGILGAGGITVPIYQSNLPDEVTFILENSGAKALFLEDLDQWAKIHDKLDALSAVETFVIFEVGDTETTKAADAPIPDDPRVMTLDAFLELGAEQDLEPWEASGAAATADDVVTYIYTSGTTGKPKGVILTHGNAQAEADALMDALPIGEDESTLMFLPLAHVFARAIHWAQLSAGYVMAFAQSVATVVDDLGETQPTWLAAVPRIYEKFHQAVMGKVSAQSGLKKSLAMAALGAAMEKVEAQQAGRSPGVGTTLKLTLLGGAVEKIAAGLRARTGGRIRFFISGGAPLSREIAVFLNALGFTVLEGYGLTETTAATHINRVEQFKLGTVGRTVKGAECKIAADGEVLLRGGMVMRGYHNRPEATAEVLDDDGWFHSGDIGVIDADGFLKITDRKKDIIVTAAGKNIAPQNVENHIKTHPLISQVAMFGDKRKFCVALITVDEEAARKALADAGEQVPPQLSALTRHGKLRELIQAVIDEKNADLPSYETIKYFEILPRDFEIGQELTPTLKVKRRVVQQNFGDLVDKLYADHA